MPTSLRMASTGPQPPTELTTDDREALVRLFDDLRDVLQVGIDHEVWFPHDLREPLRMAWADVQPQFEEAKNWIRSKNHDKDLIARGLSGAQLQMKLAGFNGAKADFHAERRRHDPPRSLGQLINRVIFPMERPEPPNPEPTDTKPKGWWGRVLRPFRSVLKWVNLLLGSIGVVIPPAEVIKEFKEGVEGAAAAEEESRGSWLARFLGWI